MNKIISLKEKALAATPNEWVYYENKYNDHVVGVKANGSSSIHNIFNGDGGCNSDRPKEDAEYIAAANPSTVLSLIDRIEKLEAFIKSFAIVGPDDYNNVHLVAHTEMPDTKLMLGTKEMVICQHALAIEWARQEILKKEWL